MGMRMMKTGWGRMRMRGRERARRAVMKRMAFLGESCPEARGLVFVRSTCLSRCLSWRSFQQHPMDRARMHAVRSRKVE